MTSLLSRTASFAGRHWLRLLIIGGALFLLSQKQVAFNVQLGKPAPGAVPASTSPSTVPNGQPTAPLPAVAPEQRPVLTEKAPAPVAAAPVEEKAGFFDRFNFFGSDEPSAYDRLTRHPEDKVAAFLRRFSNVAQAEQEKFGVPASIVLASALLYGQAGEAPGARELQNYFGLGCSDDWPGTTGRAGGRCLRAYENAWTSFRDHSLYLTSGKFEPLTQFSETDYRRWAAGMEELGFNGTDDLAEQLTRTIDRYQLFRFD